MRVAWMSVLGLAVVTSAAIACSSSGSDGGSSGSSGSTSKDGGSGGPKDADVGDGGIGNNTDLTILPDRAYTGFDNGAHTFAVPISIAGAKADLKLVASDPSMVDIKTVTNTNPEAAGTDEKWFLVTTKKAGSVTLTATSGGTSVEAKLTIAQYTSARWDTGNTRYHNAAAGGDPPCAQCHEKAGGADHSPLTLSPVDDESAKTVITAGIINGIPVNKANHKWEATPSELDGLVTYLRALPPRGIAATK